MSRISTKRVQRKTPVAADSEVIEEAKVLVNIPKGHIDDRLNMVLTKNDGIHKVLCRGSYFFIDGSVRRTKKASPQIRPCIAGLDVLPAVEGCDGPKYIDRLVGIDIHTNLACMASAIRMLIFLRRLDDRMRDFSVFDDPDIVCRTDEYPITEVHSMVITNYLNVGTPDLTLYSTIGEPRRDGCRVLFFECQNLDKPAHHSVIEYLKCEFILHETESRSRAMEVTENGTHPFFVNECGIKVFTDDPTILEIVFEVVRLRYGGLSPP